MEQQTKILCMVVVAGCAMLAACGDGDSGSMSTAGGAGSGSSAGDRTTIDVNIGEFYIHPSDDTAPAGAIMFRVINDGPEDIHELVVLKTDLAPDMLPLNADGDVDEEAEGVEAMDEVEDVTAGDSADLELNLEPGKYVLVCNIAQMEPDGTIEHHYEMGMYHAFTVE